MCVSATLDGGQREVAESARGVTPCRNCSLIISVSAATALAPPQERGLPWPLVLTLLNFLNFLETLTCAEHCSPKASA